MLAMIVGKCFAMKFVTDVIASMIDAKWADVLLAHVKNSH